MRAAVCDFHPLKKQVTNYPGDEILIIYDIGSYRTLETAPVLQVSTHNFWLEIFNIICCLFTILLDLKLNIEYVHHTPI